KQGLYISSNKAILGQAAEEGAAAGDTQRAPTIPLKADGTHDFAALNQQMIAVKQAFPTETAVILVAEPDVPYDTLVKTMDAVRETPLPNRRMLFPDVNLGEMLD